MEPAEHASRVWSNSAESERVTIQGDTGNVRINCTNPLNLLSLIANANPSTFATSNQFTIGEGTNNPNYRLSLGFGGVPTFGGVIQATAGGPAGGLLYIQPSGGKVSIGGVTPQCNLHLTGAVPVPGATLINGTDAGGALQLDDTGTAGGSGGMVIFSAANAAWRMAAIKAYAINGGGNSQGDLLFYTRPNANNASLTVAMQISAGATWESHKPSYRLDVSGDVNCTGAFRVNGVALSTSGGGISYQFNNGTPSGPYTVLDLILRELSFRKI
jgi:hypothetical protein